MIRSNQQFINKLNGLGEAKIPFFFIINFNMTKWDAIPLNELGDDILYSFDNQKKTNTIKTSYKSEDFEDYESKFDKVISHIKQGNTYLLNLTSQSDFSTDSSLKEIYENSNSPYKLLYKDEFICFSPERFIDINHNKIYTYPMKGTINADIPNAKEIIINDKKELAEHTMIVDMLRNDLSLVANDIIVDEFRYCDEIITNNKTLIQTSSKISGTLNHNWNNNIGDIISKLLPAGSISGTPKKKSLEIIEEIEKYDRGFFSGIYGVYDGEKLNSFVLIRFIEKLKNGNLVYKSGGGITIESIASKEYQEMCDKIYI